LRVEVLEEEVMLDTSEVSNTSRSHAGYRLAPTRHACRVGASRHKG